MDVNKRAPIFLAFARVYGLFESRVIPKGADILRVCLDVYFAVQWASQLEDYFPYNFGSISST